MKQIPQLLKGAIILLLSAGALSLEPAAWAANQRSAHAKQGMVVSAHHLASEAGVRILEAGGNAMDAAIATGFALAVTYPSGGNIGGGGFMLIRTSDGQLTSLDFREKAPLNVHPTMYVDHRGRYVRSSHHEGYRSVAVPGTVAGFFLAHEKFGSMPMETLMEPAIRLAEEGFPLSPALCEDFSFHRNEFLKYPASAKIFLKDDGDLYQPGDIWKQPDLAGTLKHIQNEGQKAFYHGETARLLVKAMTEHRGLITMEDLAVYDVIEREVIHGTYRGYDIYSMGPPSSGGVAIVEILNILEGYNVERFGYGSSSYYHLLTEAMRRAFYDRAWHLGDPDFYPDIPIHRLTSKSYAEELRTQIRLDAASPSRPITGFLGEESPQTTHYSVIDSKKNTVVVTYSIEQSYGSKIVAEGTGFLLNNQMGDFNPLPGVTNEEGLIGTEPNLVAPEKRMLSSMSPTLVFKKGEPFLLIGSPGGRTIISTIVQIIVNLVDFKMDLAEAIASPRIHHQWFPNEIKAETHALSKDVQGALEALGHTVTIRDDSDSQGAAMGILVDPRTGSFWGASDPRQADGATIGF